MAKVMIVTHRSQASDLLEALQHEGICQILNADEAAVSRDFPELAGGGEKPRDIEDLLGRLTKSIAFLTDYAEHRKGLAAVLAPRTVINERSYEQVVSDEQILKVIDRCEKTRTRIGKLKTKCEGLEAALEMLAPWSSLQTPVEELGRLQKTTCLAGLLPGAHFDKVIDQLADLGAAVQHIGTANNKHASLVVCLKETLSDVQKLLRSAEFEQVSFEPMTGTPADLINEQRESLSEAAKKLHDQFTKAGSLSKNLLKLQILQDHYSNLLNREQTRTAAPATEQTVLLECWVKNKDYSRLQRIVSGFKASTVGAVQPAESEEIPVEIENKKLIKPFEVITRLYGMPKCFNIDPTAVLAPFFAVFFAMCLADAGYGLVMVLLIALLIKKFQGDTKLIAMLGICGAVTIVMGALTGGWFGNAITEFVPALQPVRDKLMWFDPFEKPMYFFGLAVGLGYFQIMVGLLVALVHNLKQKDYVAALCDQLTWLVMLNSIVMFGAGKFGVLSPSVGTVFGRIALVPAAAILLFSQREGGWGARLGMGSYNLFSTIFYLGDVLSYLRLMALGMVGAGLAMAINVIAGISCKIPLIGILVAILVFVGGHLFNLILAILSAFVHTLRLQYVEFFPKFLIGGGKLFEPLAKEYKHIYIQK
jgi:V/A-type H+-transporting ATPase subunit I